jgi:hypothetical protein
LRRLAQRIAYPEILLEETVALGCELHQHCAQPGAIVAARPIESLHQDLTIVKVAQQRLRA